MAEHVEDRFKESFREEAFDLLENLEDDLMRLEDDPDDREMVDTVFRAIHTVKGSSAMFGFEQVSGFAHDVEMTLDRLRNGEFRVSRTFIDVLLECRDHMLGMIERDQEETAEDHTLSETLASRLNVASETTGKPKAVEPENLVHTVRIVFAPSRDIFRRGTKPLLLIRELLEMGEATVLCRLADEASDLSSLDPEASYASWEIFLTTTAEVNDIRDVFIFVEDDAEISVDILESGPPDSESAPRLGEILVREGKVAPDAVEDVLGSQKPIGEILVDRGEIAANDLTAALEAQKHLRSIRDKKGASGKGSVRVDARKLDDLIDLVGELVTIQARLSQASGSGSSDITRNISEELERLVVSLRETTMSIRMLPIGTTFNRYKRLVRDLSGELGKNVDLVTRGGETELDKTVIEKLNDPLVHLIRNSLDHGIEDAAARTSLGKSERGRVTLSAEHAGAMVHIAVEDDGAGLDRNRILQKAVSRGLAREGDSPGDEEVFSYIFRPGFSTAENLTTVSGRGVGMDVVRREITELGGDVRVESARGAFTRIILELPLTLAIIEGMLVRSGDDFFIFPLASVEACIEITSEHRAAESKGHMLTFRDRILPYVRIRETFALSGELPEIEQVVIINIKNQQVGFAVDEVVGSHQTVIKNLGQVYRNAEGVSGATILGDGSVALILDPPKLLLARKEEEIA